MDAPVTQKSVRVVVPFEREISGFLAANAQAAPGSSQAGRGSAALDVQPLFEAIQLGKSEAEVMPLITPVSIVATDEYQSTALHMASFGGHSKLVGLLLKKKAQVNAQDKNGWTPLHSAASSGHMKICKKLLKHGSDPRIINNSDSTALHYFARQMVTDQNKTLAREVFRLMVERPKGQELIQAKNKNGWTPLHEAVMKNNPHMVALFVKAKAPVNAKNSFGETPLRLAIRMGWKDVARLLLAGGAEVDLSSDFADIDLAKDFLRSLQGQMSVSLSSVGDDPELLAFLQESGYMQKSDAEMVSQTTVVSNATQAPASPFNNSTARGHAILHPLETKSGSGASGYVSPTEGRSRGSTPQRRSVVSMHSIDHRKVRMADSDSHPPPPTSHSASDLHEAAVGKISPPLSNQSATATFASVAPALSTHSSTASLNNAVISVFQHAAPSPLVPSATAAVGSAASSATTTSPSSSASTSTTSTHLVGAHRMGETSASIAIAVTSPASSSSASPSSGVASPPPPPLLRDPLGGEMKSSSESNRGGLDLTADRVSPLVLSNATVNPFPRSPSSGTETLSEQASRPASPKSPPLIGVLTAAQAQAATARLLAEPLTEYEVNSLSDILENPDLLAMFQKFLERAPGYGAGILFFYMEARKYRALAEDRLRAIEARSMYFKYLREEALCSIPLEHTMREPYADLILNKRSADIDLFAPVETYVHRLLTDQCVPAFKASGLLRLKENPNAQQVSINGVVPGLPPPGPGGRRSTFNKGGEGGAYNVMPAPRSHQAGDRSSLTLPTPPVPLDLSKPQSGTIPIQNSSGQNPSSSHSSGSGGNTFSLSASPSIDKLDHRTSAAVVHALSAHGGSPAMSPRGEKDSAVRVDVGKLVRDYKTLKAQKEVLETVCAELSKKCKTSEEKLAKTQQVLADLMGYLNPPKTTDGK